MIPSFKAERIHGVSIPGNASTRTSPEAAPDPGLAETLAETLGPDHVHAAAERIAGKVVRTPTLRVPVLDARAGAELFLKAENLQRIGAFKARGAMHALSRLDPDRRARGVITYSSGNHAQAVALAASSFGVTATICMPTDAPAVKVAGVRRLGAQIVFAGTTSDDRKREAHAIAERTGAPIIQPFDHEDIVCGQATATLELLEDVAALGVSLDALIVPVGGGGVIAGACIASRDLDLPVYAVEPHGCDAMARSLEAGTRVPVTPGPTLGDGLKPVMVGALNFAICRRRGVRGLRVDDQEMGSALVALLLHGKALVEPSGAAGLAAALRGGIRARDGSPARRVGVILTGGNVDTDVLTALLAAHAAAESS